AALAMVVLAWQAGGGIGSGHLSAVGASPWRAAFVLAAEIAIAGSAWLGGAAALQWWHGRRRLGALAVSTEPSPVSADAPTTELPKLAAVADSIADTDTDDGDGGRAGQLAG
ncbi:MAG TPA: hypothetical protein VKQ07_02995, partial [Jatrophihabitantaceae bacterium]|nr:hypothetical protein [Jatrophihabitantaceae bacterium]